MAASTICNLDRSWNMAYVGCLIVISWDMLLIVVLNDGFHAWCNLDTDDGWCDGDELCCACHFDEQHP